VTEEADEALMADYLTGDTRAFERLFARLAPRVYGFFARSFGGGSVAEDLMQTTFLRMHRGRDTYRRGEAVRPWLFAIAARVRTDELRRRYRLAAPAGEVEIERAEAAAAPGETAEDGIERRDRHDRVRQAIEALPETQRVVIHLHRYEEMTFAEIARALGTSEGAVRVRAFRAYEQLRASLRDLIEGGR
jgi:RNA polymerase sigma-70 factor (ECF subfamily)